MDEGQKTRPEALMITLEPGVHRSMKSGYIGGCIGGCIGGYIGGFGPRAAREARRPNELRSGEGTSIAAGKGQRRSHARGAIQAKSMEPNRTGGHRAVRGRTPRGTTEA